MHDTQPFSLEEQQIIEAVDKFISQEVRNKSNQLESLTDYPDNLVEQMAELGLFGLIVPEEYGGLGLRYPVFAAIMEVVSSGWTTLAAYINSHATVVYIVKTYGTEEQKTMFLPGLAAGTERGALCLTEPNAGSDLQAIQTSAKENGDSLALNGTKIFITNGRRATLYVTLAKTGVKENGKPKIGLLLVRRNDRGVRIGSDFHKMGFDLVDTVEVLFEDVALPVDRFVGGRNDAGMSQLLDGLEIGRIAIAASCVGLAAAALGDAMRYASERKTFGVAIEQHQAIQLRLAEMGTKLVAARLLTNEAANAKQNGKRTDMISAMAKLYASEACLEIVADAMRVHGGYGYIKDFAVERMFREAALYITGEGTSDINRLVIARRMREGGDNEILGVHV